MLSQHQAFTLFKLSQDPNNPCWLSKDIVGEFINIGSNPNSDIARALRLAKSGEEKDIVALVAMINKNPRLLLQAGNVMNCGGVQSYRETLYEFLLRDGDPDGAKQIEFGFTLIPDGENERIRQYENCRPHIERLAKQIESKQPAYNLRPLIEIIKKSSAADITEALTINDPHRLVTRNTPLRAALVAFRNAVKSKRNTGGMHYEHYTTLQQAFDLLYDEWKALSNDYTNYDKCDLVWRQIIGYLQRSLPAVDRFAFARAFDDKNRTAKFKYDDTGSFPDCSEADGDFILSGLGFTNGIYGDGCRRVAACPRACGVGWKSHVEQKLQTCRTYAARAEESVSAVVHNVLR